MKVLIVDDSKVAKILLTSHLKEYDKKLEIYEASNGEEGVKAYREFNPSLTFLDLTMPVMDGFMALELIRKIDPNARVIILTADVQQKSIDRCLELGAEAIVKKLPKKDEILTLLEKLFKDSGLS